MIRVSSGEIEMAIKAREAKRLDCKVCGQPTSSVHAKYCDACRPSKHKNRSVVVFGKRFASGKEAKRYGELLGQVEAGTIAGLKIQPRFPISINGHLVCTYIADFSYVDACGNFVVEDVKSKWTAKMPVYRIKLKLMQAVNHVAITEVIR